MYILNYIYFIIFLPLEFIRFENCQPTPPDCFKINMTKTWFSERSSNLQHPKHISLSFRTPVMDVEKNRRLRSICKKSEVGDWMSTKRLKLTTPEILTDIQKEKSLPVPSLFSGYVMLDFRGSIMWFPSWVVSRNRGSYNHCTTMRKVSTRMMPICTCSEVLSQNLEGQDKDTKTRSSIIYQPTTSRWNKIF